MTRIKTVQSAQRVLVLMALFLLDRAATAWAQSNVLQVRLAIISESKESAAAADLLTVEFSRQLQLQLLERAQIEKVFREQELSAANKDLLKLGQILGADGLVMLSRLTEGTNQFMQVRLVAVKPGVVLLWERFDWPLRSPASWAADFAPHLRPFWPKLRVLPQDAVPLSVVNLRAALQYAEARELERQLTLLTMERLSREPQLFVTERRRLHSLTAEKEWAGLDESAFWDGSFLLEGMLDNAGYSPDTITINARLIPPNGGTPLQIEASGSRSDLSQVVNRLAVQILQHLKPGVTNVPWNAAEEAEQFYTEAQWALKWNLSPQAQAAAESAWALGKRTTEAARLLIRAYAESLPDRGINGSDVPVYQVPNASWFAPLDRGLEFFVLNAPVLFAGTNAVASFQLGLRLLRPALGQLESYYYAAEQRADQAESLVALRDKVRRMIKVLDAHPPVITNRWFGRDPDPRPAYAKLKWGEGGIAFERPEEASDFYRSFLEAGVRHATLPRIIGWTWADRQRVPAVVQDLIRAASLSTNAMIQLEGLFLTLLRTADDEEGSLLRAEEALETAAWMHRAEIYRNAENAALVENIRQGLIKKYGGDSINTAYPHEPFASFKHRLRQDFLASASATNLAVLDELFPNTNVKMETPEQARELLPMMETLAQRLATNRIRYKLSQLRDNAGIAAAAPPPSAPVQAAATVLDAKFVPWRVTPSGIFPNKKTHCSGMIWRNDRLWVQAFGVDDDYSGFDAHGPVRYLAIDSQRGVQEVVSFPESFGNPGKLFEVSHQALFVEAGGHLYEYRFDQKAWRGIPAPMEGATRLVWVKDRLFVERKDGLLSVLPGNNKVELLVSNRRTPAVNEIDSIWSARARIFARADGKLGVLVEEDRLTFDPVANHWQIQPLPLKGKKAFQNMTADYFSPVGAQRLLMGQFTRHYLIGFWGNDAAESLLMDETGIGSKPPPTAEKQLSQQRWDWPTKYPLEHSQIVAGELDKLWVLAPRKLGMMAGNQEPVKFSDARDATLFCFTPEAREPLFAAVRFPMDEVADRSIINGVAVDVLEPNNFGFMHIFTRLDRHEGNMAFWMRVSNGLVFGGPKFSGHWFLSDAAFERMSAAQRPAEGASTPTQSTP